MKRRESSQSGVRRLSLSLPQSLCDVLDRMVTDRGFPSRSQAVAELLNRQLTLLQAEDEQQVMAGTITLFFDESRRGLGSRLAAIQRQHVDEVVSSLNILLEDHHSMQILVVQGPVGKLRAIADEFTSCKGVKAGELTLTTSILPPVHTRRHRDWPRRPRQPRRPVRGGNR